MIEILNEQPTQEKPYIVDNYPYGYTLRTQIKYWVETTKRGQRFVRQTLNPKTDKWNKPKKSTYSQILLVGLNEEDHVTYTCLSLYSLDEAKRFKNKYEKYFNDYQQNEIKNIIKMSEVYDKVEYSFRARKYKHKITGDITESVPIFEMNNYIEVDDDGNILDREKKDNEQTEINRKINHVAISNASKETTIEKAIETFKRLK